MKLRLSMAPITSLLVALLLLTGCESQPPVLPSPTTLVPPAVKTPIVPPSTPTPEGSHASPAALAYLNYAVDYIQQHGLHSDKVDWVAVRRQVFGPDLRAQTTADTYPAITYVLNQLPVNHHSYLITPEQVAELNKAVGSAIGLTASYAQRKVTKVQPGSMADKAGVRTGDTIVTINDTPVESLDVTRFSAQLYFGTGVKLGLRRGDGQNVTVEINHDPVDPTSMLRGRRLPDNIGYIALPGVSGSPVYTYYASIAQQMIEDIDRTPTCGWIVDLQGNTGGAVAPMFAAIGPIVGEGQLGSFTGPAGTMAWLYRNGQVLIGDQLAWQVDQPYHLQRANPPVAVLTDGGTASAGEAVLIAFRGRPDTRSFGEPTFGLPTANITVPLSDGAVLVLTDANDVDLTGRIYEDKIPPDVPVTAMRLFRGTDKDPVLQAGVAWLQGQPACTNH